MTGRECGTCVWRRQAPQLMSRGSLGVLPGLDPAARGFWGLICAHRAAPLCPQHWLSPGDHTSALCPTMAKSTTQIHSRAPTSHPIQDGP